MNETEDSSTRFDAMWRQHTHTPARAHRRRRSATPLRARALRRGGVEVREQRQVRRHGRFRAELRGSVNPPHVPRGQNNTRAIKVLLQVLNELGLGYIFGILPLKYFVL